MPNAPQTTLLPLEDVLHRLDCFINQDNVGTIFPENFFTSIRHYLTENKLRDDVLYKACAWRGADIYVHPYLSRADAVHEAEEALENAVQNWNNAQLPVENKDAGI